MSTIVDYNHAVIPSIGHSHKYQHIDYRFSTYMCTQNITQSNLLFINSGNPCHSIPATTGFRVKARFAWFSFVIPRKYYFS